MHWRSLSIGRPPSCWHLARGLLPRTHRHLRRCPTTPSPWTQRYQPHPVRLPILPSIPFAVPTAGQGLGSRSEPWSTGHRRCGLIEPWGKLPHHKQNFESVCNSGYLSPVGVCRIQCVLANLCTWTTPASPTRFLIRRKISPTPRIGPNTMPWLIHQRLWLGIEHGGRTWNLSGEYDDHAD